MKQNYSNMSQEFEVTYFDNGVGKCVIYTKWEEAYPAVRRFSEQFGKANLIILDNAVDGTQIEQKIYQYQQGSCVVDKAIFYRRMNMQDTPSFDEAIGSAEEQAAARDAQAAAKAAAQADEKARKAEEKALAKAAREEAKATAKAQKAQAKAEKDAARAAAKAAGVTTRGARTKYKDEDIIHIPEAYVGKNPKRVGSASAPRFDLYQEGMTVGAYKKVNISFGAADINWDSEHGFITVEVVPVPESVPVAEETPAG